MDECVIRRKPSQGHFGLRGIRERAEVVGGQLDISSKRDAGTQLDLSIPAGVAYGVVRQRLPWFRRLFRTQAAPDDHLT
jgi:glucose-6-phosphate-specific signal transduction histidine kinase